MNQAAKKIRIAFRPVKPGRSTKVLALTDGWFVASGQEAERH
jgi:hypothetical protein